MVRGGTVCGEGRDSVWRVVGQCVVRGGTVCGEGRDSVWRVVGQCGEGRDSVRRLVADCPVSAVADCLDFIGSY